MTLSELTTQLKQTGYPVAYRYFPGDVLPQMPFIVYYVDETNNFFADGVVYRKISRVEVLLYTKQKNTTAEAILEAILEGLAWEKSEEWIQDEACTEITYNFEILEEGEIQNG